LYIVAARLSQKMLKTDGNSGSINSRDVSTGATGVTEVAPKFSDTLTLYPPGGGGRFCPPSQRSHLNFPCGYVPGYHINAIKADELVKNGPTKCSKISSDSIL
jgi:hypothetical protein